MTEDKIFLKNELMAFLYSFNKHLEKEMRWNIPFIIEEKHLNYLEINLTRKTQNLNEENITSEQKASSEQKRKYSCRWLRTLRSQFSQNDV